MQSWVFINSEKQSEFRDTSYTQEFNESPVFLTSLKMAPTSVGPFCQSVFKVNVFTRGWCRLTRGLFQLSQLWAPGGKRWALFPEGCGLHKSFLFLIALLTPFHRLYDNFNFQTEHQCCIYGITVESESDIVKWIFIKINCVIRGNGRLQTRTLSDEPMSFSHLILASPQANNVP